MTNTFELDGKDVAQLGIYCAHRSKSLEKAFGLQDDSEFDPDIFCLMDKERQKNLLEKTFGETSINLDEICWSNETFMQKLILLK